MACVLGRATASWAPLHRMIPGEHLLAVVCTHPPCASFSMGMDLNHRKGMHLEADFWGCLFVVGYVESCKMNKKTITGVL